MASIPGVDYAWSHPSPASLKAAGMQFACRYLSGDRSKILTLAEANALAAAGVASVVVWESTANRALSGRAGGIADAKSAAAQAKAAGQPTSRPIYFAVDFDATAVQQAVINTYLDGAASVLGRTRVGIYGGYYLVKRALDGGHAAWAWQTIAWSGGQWDARAVIRQGAQKTIGGVQCDLNTALAADYGQWTPGHAPTAPHPQEDPMPDPKDLWAYKGLLNGKPDPHDAYSYLRGTNAEVQAIARRLDALTATVSTLAKALGDSHPSVDTATLVAAVQKAIADATVDVAVTVHDDTIKEN